MNPQHDPRHDLDDDLGRLVHRAASSRAALAPDVEVLQRRVQVALGRRARRRRAVAAGGAALAVAGLVGGPAALEQTGALSRVALPGATGTRLVAPPAPSPSSPSPSASDPSETTCPGPVAAADGPAVDAFVGSGYTLDDAWALAHLWDRPCAEAKVAAGRRLAAGEPLPVEAGSSGVHQQADPAAEAAFSDAGYDGEDAARLARLWGYTDPAQARLKAGRLVLEGTAPPSP